MLVDDRHMFPLKLLHGTIGDNYFMSADGKIWSNRASKKPVELTGSKTKSGVYYKFGNNWGSGYRLDTLQRQAKAHARWHIETTGPIKFAKTDGAVAVADRVYASTVDAGIKARGAIIGRVHKGHLVFGSAPKIHTSEQSVKDEMTRLAAEHPGVKFVRLNIVSSVVAGGVIWE